MYDVEDFTGRKCCHRCSGVMLKIAKLREIGTFVDICSTN